MRRVVVIFYMARNMRTYRYFLGLCPHENIKLGQTCNREQGIRVRCTIQLLFISIDPACRVK